MDYFSCEACGKFQEGLEIGTHWICEDCNHIPGNVQESMDWDKWENAES